MDFFLGIAGKREGPLPEAEVRRRIIAGELQPNNLCWTEGWTDWRRVIDTFPDAFNAAPQHHPAAAGPPPLQPSRSPPPPGHSHSAPTQPKVCGLAIAALVLGLLGLFFSIVTAIPAVICGHMARKQIRESAGSLNGGGLALGGLMLGYVWLVLAVFFIGFALFAAAMSAY